ncbi:MAG: DUF4340 domain-containing protein [Ruminococcus sp.]|nr:DUF4340 domain-containing protein [Ruminococcus sp.]
MKRVIIATIALLVVAGASFGAFFAVKNKSDKETQQKNIQTADKVLFDFDSDSVTEVVFNCADGEYKVIKDDDGKWSLDNKEFAIDQTYMQALCTFASELTAEDSFGEADSSKKTMYGLDSPETITFYDGTDEYKIYVGNITPTNDYYYVMAEGKNNIYTVDSINGSVFKTSRLMMKAKDLIPYGDTEIQQITLEKDGKTVYDLKFDSETSMWSLPSEYSKLPFDQTAVTAMITSLTRLEAEQLLDEYLEDLSKYGFDKPAAQLTVKGKDGTERKLIISSKKANNNTYTYVLDTSSNQVQTYYVSDLSFMNYTPLRFMPDSVTTAGIYSVTDFKLDFEDIHSSFNLNMTDRKLKIDGNDVDIENAENSTTFQYFYNAMSVLVITDIDIKAKPDNSEPLLTVEYDLSDGTHTKVQFVEADDIKCYVFIDDEYTGAMIDTAVLTGKNSVRSFYRNLCEMTGIVKTVQQQPSAE